jgi:hypothetical protein
MLVSSLVVAGALLAVVFAAPLGWDKAPSWGCASSDFPFGGCVFDFGEGGAVPGSGVVKTESRQVPAFTALSIAYPVEVVIHQGDAQSVSVEAEDNLLPQLATRVSGSTLYIENSEHNRVRRVNPSKPVRITLTVTDLHALDASSAGTVNLDGLQTESLDISASGAGKLTLSKLDVSSLSVDLSGAGNVEASGSAGTINLGISGLGNFLGGDLAAQSASVDISGAGSATLWLKNELSADISGLGSVNYYGSPKVSKDISGLGSVNRLGDK